MLAKDYRTQAWNALSGKWGIMAVCTLLYEVILGACSSFSVVSGFNHSGIILCFSILGGVGNILVGGPLFFGTEILSLNVARGATVKAENLFDGFKIYLKTLTLYLLNTIFIFLWSLLFLIPGIIKSISYSMSYYILADNPELDADDARKQSMAMMEGNKGRYFCLVLSFIGWMLLCVLTLGILTLWIMPYMQTAKAEFYQSLLAERAQYAQQPSPDGLTGSAATAASVEENGATSEPPVENFEGATNEPAAETADEPPTDNNDGKQNE